MISFRFHHAFGLAIETVEGQPVLGWKASETIEEAEVYFFDGFVITLPFCKIHIGEVFDYFG